MVLHDLVVRGITEDMGPDGHPVPGHRLTIHVAGHGVSAAVIMTGAGLVKIHAMLDPWARALAVEETGRTWEVNGG